LIGLVLALAASLAAAPGESSWRIKADYVEACSCHLFVLSKLLVGREVSLGKIIPVKSG